MTTPDVTAHGLRIIAEHVELVWGQWADEYVERAARDAASLLRSIAAWSEGSGL